MSRNGWKRYKLSQIMDIIGGGTPRTTVKEYWGGNIPWLSVVDFGGGNRHVHKTEKTITEKGLEESSTKILEKGQLIISARGTVGEVAQLGRDMAFNQSCYGLDGKSDIITNDFLYYLVKDSVNELKRNTHGAVFDTITRQTFDCIDVDVPSLPTQKQISKILGDLDEKIEMNHQMNKTLESIAQAVFKKWFVDFEFPGYEKTKFVNGLPEGWKELPLTDIADVLGGGTPSTTEASFWGDEIPFFTPKDVGSACYVIETEKRVTRKGLDNCNSKLYERNTVFITARGTVGKVCMAGCNMAMNQSCYAVLSKDGNERQLFIYLLVKNLAEELIQKSHGTVFETITTETFRKTRVVEPIPQSIAKFNNHVSSLYNLILSNMLEIKYLVKYRDSLLPRLMAGEVAV